VEEESLRTVVSQDSQAVLLPARVDASTVADVRRELQTALGLGTGDLVVDLRSVAVLDAAGLGVLVATHRRAANEGRRLVLRGVPPGVARVFAITRLYRVLNVEHPGSSAGVAGAGTPAAALA
jgi:anti-sigma B factor antagonist